MASHFNHGSTSLYLGLYALLIAFGSLYSTAGFLGFDTWSLDFLFQIGRAHV